MFTRQLNALCDLGQDLGPEERTLLGQFEESE